MKLHLPTGLRTTLLAAMAVVAISSGSAFARSLTTDVTEAGDITYNGHVYTVLTDTDPQELFHTRDFSEYIYNAENGTWSDGTPVAGNNGSAVTSAGTGLLWGAFSSGTSGPANVTYGHTLHLASTDTQLKAKTDFTPFTLGGLIADAGTRRGSGITNATYWFWRENTAFELNGTGDVNLTVNDFTSFSYGTTATARKGGTWTVATDKALVFDNAASRTGSTFTFVDGIEVNVNGGGQVYVGRTGNGIYNVTFNEGVTMNVDGNSTVNIGGTNSTITFNEDAILNIASGSTVKLNAPTVNALTTNGTSHERTRAEGNGFGTANFSASIAAGEGTLNVSSVTAWKVNGIAAQYDADTHTVSCSGNSDTYYFYSATGDGSAIADAAGANHLVVDTQDSVNAIDMGDAAHTLSTLTIKSGVVETSHADREGTTSGEGFVKNGDVIINGGATLRVVGAHDAFGYNAGSCTKSVTLTGTSDATATLELNQTTDNSVTMKTNIIMNGNAAIKGDKGFNTYGCSISVNGTNNLIDRLDIRNNVTLNVANGGTLTIGCTTLNEAGNHKVTLAGRGTTTVNNASAFGEVQLTGGSLVLNANATMTSLSTDNGSSNSSVTVAEGATLNISGNLQNSWGIKTLTVDGTVKAADFVISTGGMVNTINGSGVINADSLECSNATTKAAFSGVTLNLGDGGIRATTNKNFTDKPIEFGDMTVGVREGSEGWSTSLNTVSLAGTTTGTVFTPGAEQTITINGNLGGTGKLVKSGEGTLVLAGANTYAGGTTVTEGTLSVEGNSALNGDVTVSGGLLSIGAEVALNSLTLGTGATIDLTTGASLSATTLNIGGLVTLGSTLSGSLSALTEGSLTLFSGVSSFTVGGNDFVAGTAIDTVFSGVDASKYVLNYADNTVSITLAPTGGNSFIVGTTVTDGTFDNLSGSEGTNSSISGSVTITNNISMENGSSAAISEGATVSNKGVTITGTGADSSISGTESDAAFAVNNAAVTVDTVAEGETATLEGALVNSSVTNNSGAELIVSGGDSTVTKMDILNAAEINFTNVAEKVEVEQLTLSAGATVGVFDGELKAIEKGLTVTETLIVDGNSVMNANLTVAEGVTMFFNGTLTMGSTVDLAEGTDIYLSESLTKQFANGIILIDSIDAESDISTLIGHNIYGVVFDVDGNAVRDAEGNLTYTHLTTTLAGTNADGTHFMATPEPATATLSLLALAGLCARRRRH